MFGSFYSFGGTPKLQKRKRAVAKTLFFVVLGFRGCVIFANCLRFRFMLSSKRVLLDFGVLCAPEGVLVDSHFRILFFFLHETKLAEIETCKNEAFGA